MNLPSRQNTHTVVACDSIHQLFWFIKNWITFVHYKADLSIKAIAYLNVVVRTHVRTAGGTVVPRA